MAAFFSKAPSSRLTRMNNVSWMGSGTVTSTTFQVATQQVLITSQVSGWFALDNLGTVPTTNGGTGFYLPANTSPAAYTVTPGMQFSFSSTTTSSGVISVVEAA
jgi:hypothetical protein